MREPHPIKAILRQRGIRQDWFAEQVGLEQSRLSHILAYRRPEPPDLVPRASRILGVSESDLRPAASESVAA